MGANCVPLEYGQNQMLLNRRQCRSLAMLRCSIRETAGLKRARTSCQTRCRQYRLSERHRGDVQWYAMSLRCCMLSMRTRPAIPS